MTERTRARVSLNAWSLVSVAWMTKVVRLAAAKELVGSDLPILAQKDLAANTLDWVRAFEAGVAEARRVQQQASRGGFGSGLVGGDLGGVSINSVGNESGAVESGGAGTGSGGKGSQKARRKDKRGGKSHVGLPALFPYLWTSARAAWVSSGVCMLLGVAGVVGAPLVLQQIIDLAAFHDAVPANVDWDTVPIPQLPGFPLVTKNAYLLAAVLLVLKVLASVFGRLCDSLVRRVAFNIRSLLIKAVVRKSLNIKPDPRFSPGYVLNLINVDSESIAIAAEQCHLLWALPLQIFSAVALLAVMLGSSVGAGVGALMGSFTILGVTIPLFIISSLPKMVKHNDLRVKLIREALTGIQLLKIRSLVPDFELAINVARLEQLRWLGRFLYGVVSFVVAGQLASLISVVSAFTLYAARGNAISASIIFPSFALFNLLVQPLITLPQVINNMVSASVSWGRIYDYLISIDRDNVLSDIGSPDVAISMKNASFNWPSSSQKVLQKTSKNAAKVRDSPNDSSERSQTPRNVLEDANLAIKKGTFVAVVGGVGSGKSSLLNALLGNLQINSGSATLNGTIAFCNQQPWIQTGTVEDNILFGSKLNQEKLDQAVNVSCLESDLAIMANGIKTILGEKGSSVSGGQKTRIALARAVYSDADIYLLDDPLSSLDAKVSRRVFELCLKTALKDKTIILATHNHDILNQTDHIIFISESGKIIQGSFTELTQNQEFSSFITSIDDNKGPITLTSAAGAAYERVTPSLPAPIVENYTSILADEESETGNVKWHTYKSYIEAFGGYSAILMTTNLIIHGGIMKSTKFFHKTAVSGVLNAPLWWFESQQIGRIMNRFTKDMAAIDQRLLPQVFQLIAAIGGLFSILVILAINAPIILVGVVPVSGLYLYVLKYYRAAMRQLKRLESTQRSPLYSHISEALEGVTTILAYKKQRYFADTTNLLLDHSNSPLFFKFGTVYKCGKQNKNKNRNLGYSAIGIDFRDFKSSIISANTIGNALVYTNSMTSLMNMLLQSSANMETEMVCVERLVEYAERLPIEGPAKLDKDPAPESWPHSGRIELKEVSAFYHSNPDKAVLKNVSLTIASGEKVCVVGRTGSGKSTLLSVLLRFADFEGSLTVDDRVGFQTLRQSMEVIPQDIFLFSGTLRSTLDHHSIFTDAQLWATLESVGLKSFVGNLENKLETSIENGGSNFSLGQRQLLFFARILLLKPKIVLMDEATSSVDPDTESTLRKIIQENFGETTVVSVLHRLQAGVLEDFDKVLVMDAGKVAEFDSPKTLLATPGSIFASLFNSTNEKHK
ncbi:hypothetical protein HK100_005319 [Physocladia obscura]|uniref:Uncharacterized protein n=1 Tax=Physocladia obscura TaxID=109957 RepID=A0AAD5TAC7_9FUNG|nr:hypothetical protein HK100_005319 [Physocladia obscura]